MFTLVYCNLCLIYLKDTIYKDANGVAIMKGEGTGNVVIDEILDMSDTTQQKSTFTIKLGNHISSFSRSGQTEQLYHGVGIDSNGQESGKFNCTQCNRDVLLGMIADVILLSQIIIGKFTFRFSRNMDNLGNSYDTLWRSKSFTGVAFFGEVQSSDIFVVVYDTRILKKMTQKLNGNVFWHLMAFMVRAIYNRQNKSTTCISVLCAFLNIYLTCI